MANRLKEDEKNERIIQKLLKLPENRRIHREFTHRVKSVSMAKFTPQEVSVLQGGGNTSAREIYLKEWDPQRNSFPDGSNIERLRDFIKHVYVDKRYTGERNMEKPPRARMGETGDFNGNRRIDTYPGGSRSPSYDNTSERHRPSPGGRSPTYDQDNRQNSYFKRSPARAEVINDWRREDRFGNGRRFEDRSSDGGSKPGGRSPDSQRDSDMSSPPIVRPVRDIFREIVSPLRVIGPPKATGGKSSDGSAPTKRSASTNSLASSADANPSEIKVEASFIDFDYVPEPPTTVTVPQTQQAGADASSSPQTASSSSDWANFDSVTEVRVSAAASNSVESLLSGLSIPAPTSGPTAPAVNLSSFQSSGSQGSFFESSFGYAAPTSVLPPGSASIASLGPAPQLANPESLLNAPTGGQWHHLKPQQHSLLPGVVAQPVSQLVTPVASGSSSNKLLNPLVPNAHRLSGASIVQVGQAETNPARESSLNVDSGGRKALPEDLFTMNYSYTPSLLPGWYSGYPNIDGAPIQYNAPMALPNYPTVSRSTNPFDVGNEPSPVQEPKQTVT